MWDKIKGIETKHYFGGVWVASTEEIAEIMNTTTRSIERYVQKGMPLHEASLPKFNIFDVKQCQKWRNKNMRRSNNREHRSNDQEDDIDDGGDKADIPPQDFDKSIKDMKGKIEQANSLLQLHGTDFNEAERVKKVLDALMAAIKLGEASKELIPKKDTERVVIEIVAMLIAGYKQDIKVLPKELDGRNEKQIREILENTYKTNIEKFQKIAKSSFLSEKRLYDVIEVVIDMLRRGIEVDEIIRRMGENESV